MRVLDTSALLHWPRDKLAGGHCVNSQRAELIRLSEERMMLVESAQIEWHEVNTETAVTVARKTGDFARLSDVDLEVLALTIELQAMLVTDDYRLQNICKHEGIQFESIQTSGAKEQWYWEMRCTGCRRIKPVTEGVQRSKKDAVADCEVCGSLMQIKRVRR